MRKCPFCGAEIEVAYPYLGELRNGGMVFYHYCKFEEELGTVITIYGKTEEEIIAKLTGEYYAKEQTSESV